MALLNKIITLPTDLKTKVALFIDYLIYTKKIQKDKIKKTPVAGFGTINYITTPDFDEPLEDFKMKLVSIDTIFDQYTSERVW